MLTSTGDTLPLLDA